MLVRLSVVCGILLALSTFLPSTVHAGTAMFCITGKHPAYKPFDSTKANAGACGTGLDPKYTCIAFLETAGTEVDYACAQTVPAGCDDGSCVQGVKKSGGKHVGQMCCCSTTNCNADNLHTMFTTTIPPPTTTSTAATTTTAQTSAAPTTVPVAVAPVAASASNAERVWMGVAIALIILVLISIAFNVFLLIVCCGQKKKAAAPLAKEEAAKKEQQKTRREEFVKSVRDKEAEKEGDDAGAVAAADDDDADKKKKKRKKPEQDEKKTEEVTEEKKEKDENKEKEAEEEEKSAAGDNSERLVCYEKKSKFWAARDAKHLDLHERQIFTGVLSQADAVTLCEDLFKAIVTPLPTEGRVARAANKVRIVGQSIAVVDNDNDAITKIPTDLYSDINHRNEAACKMLVNGPRFYDYTSLLLYTDLEQCIKVMKKEKADGTEATERTEEQGSGYTAPPTEE